MANNIRIETLEIIKQHVEHQGTPGELPTAEELLRQTPPEVPSFDLRGHDSKEALLNVQYSILRTEGTEGLRYSVNSFKIDPSMMDDKLTCIYTSVRVRGYLMTRIGPVCRIEFSTRRAGRKINWLLSRRLTPGTILALTTTEDRFQTVCKVATVIQRPYHGGLDQSPPEVDIMWAEPSQSVLNPDQELIMVEARVGYYEAARHALVGLQLAAKASTPIDKYVVSGDTSDSSPWSFQTQPQMDLTTLAQNLNPCDEPKLYESLAQYDVSTGMPKLAYRTTLDASQLEAIHRILTKELAIIQGPPGTGKTFTSVTALTLMLANRKRGDPPIIVAAQTNHALDLLLGHSMDRGVRVLRVGGRTDIEAISERTVYSLRQRFKSHDPNFRRLDNARRANIDVLHALVRSVFSDELLDPAALKNAGVLTDKQYVSFTNDVWVDTVPNELGPFSTWLGEERIRSSVLREMMPDFEEEEKDEEFEVDVDAQVVTIAEDDMERGRLRGMWLPISQTWTGITRQINWRTTAEKLLNRVEDLWKIPKPWRGAVYQVLQAKMLDAVMPEFAAHLTQTINCCKALKINKWECDVRLVRDQDIEIVGCTTTGLGKYRGFLAAMKPSVMLIEEAAQTREANITSALFPSLERLILVGDHKQLTPNCDIQWLGAAPFHLNMSLFERMADHLKIPMTMLNQQRRMIPEIRYILSGFYPLLQDHPLVCDPAKRPPVPGMGVNCWLFDHHWPEDMDTNQSKFNQLEAEMVANFTVYLIQNGTPSSKITILTYYHGQRKLILRLLKKHPSVTGHVFTVRTVDSYQGEENDIVLLSLVRSPKDPESYSVGFLADENRAVVAVSRAKRGFYMFCNVDNMLRANEASFDIWARVWNGFAEQKYVERDAGMPVVCQNHGNKAWMTEPKSFDGNAGGCWVKCGDVRPCGHPCQLMCHPMPHDQLLCQAGCEIMVPVNSPVADASRDTDAAIDAWGNFARHAAAFDTIEDEDEQHRKETGGPRQPLVIKDTWRPKGLDADGRRVAAGKAVVVEHNPANEEDDKEEWLIDLE